MASPAQARELVEEISDSHGLLKPKYYDYMDEIARHEVERIIMIKDKLIGSNVITLAQNLYTSSARFVFELLQNADDNHFKKARNHGEDPRVSFDIYPDRIVMECNEDGFNSANLTAICNIGKSSKTGAQGYIGEKGIGFKSVFMAAYKVLIQSGHFSFYFLHRKHDSGYGMISPLWQANEEYLGDRLTRITLFLHDDGDDDESKRQSDIIHRQFEEIHHEILIFMKNISKITISFYEQNCKSNALKTITYTKKSGAGKPTVLTKSIFQNNKKHDEVKYYHITEHVATKLARNENRIYSEEEKEMRTYSKSKVVLAFPLTSSSVPILAKQCIFAFLPIRRMGFTFLIHADFVTQANRQDIVTSSVRNERLLDGIADAFIKAASQFCEHESLQYQWMRYLPGDSDFPWNDFWSSLIHKIRNRVCNTPVFRSGSEKLRLLRDLRAQQSNHLDSNGSPIFRDKQPELYMSPKYLSSDIHVLKNYDLRNMSSLEILDRVDHDLKLSDSRLKSCDNLAWQSRAAKLLHHIITTRTRSAVILAVQQLEILPLRNGLWVSILSGAVYYHKADLSDLEIPLDLGRRVITPVATSNPDRKKLFDALGVQNAPVSLIRDDIWNKYRNFSIFFNILPELVFSHLRFLYLSHHLVSQSQNHYDMVRILSKDGSLLLPSVVNFYIQTDDPYGTNLLKPRAPGSRPGDGAPGLYHIYLVHEIYFTEVPSPPTKDTPIWIDWMCSKFFLRRNLRLVDETKPKLSSIGRYLSQSRPEKFLGFLQATWGLEMPKKNADISALVKELGDVKVLCRSQSIKMCPLKHTYLLTEELEAVCNRYMIKDEFFPWLRLEDISKFDTFPTKWEALGKSFGLGIHGADLKFTLDILRSIVEANPDVTHLKVPKRLYELYIHLQAKLRELQSSSTSKESVLRLFNSKPSIFVPKHDRKGAKWVFPKDCVWQAPAMMTTKASLEAIYSKEFSGFDEDRSQLYSFFSRSLAIPDCTWENLVAEIRDFKSSGTTDFDRISELYTCLNELLLKSVGISPCKTVFESEALICGWQSQSITWHKSTQCLWSSVTHIKGMFVLNELYSDLENLFVDKLGVQRMTAEMVYKKLSSQEASTLSPEEAKETLLAFNSFLEKDRHEFGFDPKPVLQSSVFPVRYPNNEVELRNGSQGFALLDRKLLGDDFSGIAKFLDMSMEEIRDFRPFIRWAGLEGRYLSAAVREISSADPVLTRPISSLNRDIKRKAHALSRIAVTYKSPRITRGNLAEFYALLKSSETHETEKITAELLLHQDGELLTVEKGTATLHIDESPSVLRFYVPRNHRSQEVCFNSKLPLRLCEWMMTVPTTGIQDHVPMEAISAVQSVLNVGNNAISEILDESGIFQIHISDDFMSEVEEFDEPGQETPAEAAEAVVPAAESGPAEPAEETEEMQESESEEYRVNRTSGVSGIPVALTGMAQPVTTRVHGRSRSDSDSPVEHTPASSVSLRDDSPSVIDEDGIFLTAQSRNASSEPRLYRTVIAEEVVSSYTALLRKTVDVARLAEFPSHGVFDMSALRFALTEEDSEDAAMVGNYRLHSNSQLERDMKIGAAGELYVFEMLSHLDPDLPNFSRENWKSNMRKYVTSHPDYSTMHPWEGREIADIMYNDTSGVFTNLLISKGYLSHDIWGGATPQYFIEVKTTTATCETPFYMSKAQYKKMQIQSNNMESRQANGLYVIFRVFDIGKDSMGLKILVDPESMRQREELAFTAETWSVVTGR